MMEQSQWTDESDGLIQYLYQDLKIFNWNLISQELSKRMGIKVDASLCRTRYALKCGPVIRDEWTPQQEKQLYRLHNQNGNKWAVIAQNLLGRNDNCVKNHFYSKLRKSLRTLNKIAKLYLKKQAKQVSDVVLYKLTEATDQSLKQTSEISKQLIAMSFGNFQVIQDLKNRLLQYQTDQKDIKQGMDFISQKQLLEGLSQFNKIYKKKSKKQKITILGTENLKKKSPSQNKGKTKGKKIKNKKQNLSSSEQFYQQNSYQYSVKVQPQKKVGSRIQAKVVEISRHNQQYSQAFQSRNRYQKSQSEYSVPKRTVNYLIKAPSKQQQANYQKQIDLKSQSRKSIQDNEFHIDNLPVTFLKVNVVTGPQPTKPANRIQDILKAQGILQNGQYNYNNKQYFRRSASSRSFSVCSESSHLDMFGDDLGFGNGINNLSQMQNSSQFFSNPQNQ